MKIFKFRSNLQQLQSVLGHRISSVRYGHLNLYWACVSMERIYKILFFVK